MILHTTHIMCDRPGCTSVHVESKRTGLDMGDQTVVLPGWYCSADDTLLCPKCLAAKDPTGEAV